jgi:hypothetical protein
VVKTGMLRYGKGPPLFVPLLLAAAVLLALVVGPGAVAVEKGGKKVVVQKQAFVLYQKKCLSCHDSVADPEKPGRTRDDWHLVVNVMHGHGLDLTPQEGETIINLLYELRKGLEKEAG